MKLSSPFRRLVTRSKREVKQRLRAALPRHDSTQSRLTPSVWRLSSDSEKGLTLQGIALNDLVAKWGSPLHVVDAEALRDNVRRFVTVPRGAAQGCEVFYSYKTNPIPGVLSLIHELGVGAEIISHFELWLARRLGVPPERIVYNGPAKSLESIEEAVLLGVQTINVNHAEEIDRIATVAQRVAKRPRIGLRVTTGDAWSAQFGIPTAGGAALAAYAKARASNVLDVVGIHAHLGGMIHAKETLLEAVDAVLEFVWQLEHTLGMSLEVLNFGGSLATPTVYRPSTRDRRLNRALYRDLPEPAFEHSLSIQDYVATLVSRVSDQYRQRARTPPRIFVEPGRAMTGNTQMLVGSVITTKQHDDKRFLVLDTGINIAESVRSEYHQIFPVYGCTESRERVYTVVGPICSPSDTLYEAWRGPELAEGDTVVIMDAGAYFVPFSNSFSFPRPAVVMLDHGQVSLLRRAERFDDIVAYDRMPSIAGESRMSAMDSSLEAPDGG